MVLSLLQWRQATWPVVVTLIAGLIGLRLQDRIDPTLVLLGAAVTLVLWGAARGRLQRPGEFMLQTAGMVLFAVLALTALAVDPALGRYLVAAGWLGHAAWDFAHYRADTVVSRSFAEWCAVVDLLGGVSILVL